MAIGSRSWIMMAMSLAVFGCSEKGPPPPATYAVSGTVYDSDGQPLRGGMVQFIAKSDPNRTMSSMIAADGSYALTTMHGNDNLPGAIVGECQVLVTLPIVPGEVPQTVTLANLVRIEPQADKVDVHLASGATSRN